MFKKILAALAIAASLIAFAPSPASASTEECCNASQWTRAARCYVSQTVSFVTEVTYTLYTGTGGALKTSLDRVVWYRDGGGGTHYNIQVHQTGELSYPTIAVGSNPSGGGTRSYPDYYWTAYRNREPYVLSRVGPYGSSLDCVVRIPIWYA